MEPPPDDDQARSARKSPPRRRSPPRRSSPPHSARRSSPPTGAAGPRRSSPPRKASPPAAANNATVSPNDFFANVPDYIGEYEFLQPWVILGRGSFSVVFEGVQRGTDRRVAIKAIYLGPENPESLTGFKHELRILCMAMGHPSIVTLLNHYQHENIGYLVFDLYERGEVFHEIIPHHGLHPRENVGPYFAQLMDAVEHLHASDIYHLDIKTENMFVDARGRVHLGDFGLSALSEDAPLLGCRGSLGYAAPEVIRSHAAGGAMATRAQYDGEKADIWSCGVVLFVLIYGMAPWEVARDASVEFRMFKATDGYPNIKPWNRMPNVIRTLLHRMLAIHPGRRWSATQVKQYIAQNMGWHVPPALSS